MKYKRQLMSGMFTIALIASGTSVFAADIPVTGIKTVEQTAQVRMKSSSSDITAGVKDTNGKNLKIKNNTVKKSAMVKHKKVVKTHKVKTTVPVTDTTQTPQ